jgi:hypothetical protein
VHRRRTVSAFPIPLFICVGECGVASTVTEEPDNVTDTEHIPLLTPFTPRPEKPRHGGRILIVVAVLVAVSVGAIFVIRARNEDHRWTKVGSTVIGEHDVQGSSRPRQLIGNGHVYVGILETRLVSVDAQTMAMTTTPFSDFPEIGFVEAFNEVQGLTVVTGDGFVAQLEIHDWHDKTSTFASLHSADGLKWTVINGATDTIAVATMAGQAASFGTTRVNTFAADDDHWTASPAPWPPAFKPRLAAAVDDTTVVVGDDLQGSIGRLPPTVNIGESMRMTWIYSNGSWSNRPAPTSTSLFEDPAALVAADGAWFYVTSTFSASGTNIQMWSSVDAKLWTPVRVPTSINQSFNYPGPVLAVTTAGNQTVLAFEVVPTDQSKCILWCGYDHVVPLQLTKDGAVERPAAGITAVAYSDIYVMFDPSGNAQTLKFESESNLMSLWQCATGVVSPPNKELCRRD